MPQRERRLELRLVPDAFERRDRLIVAIHVEQLLRLDDEAVEAHLVRVRPAHHRQRRGAEDGDDLFDDRLCRSHDSHTGRRGSIRRSPPARTTRHRLEGVPQRSGWWAASGLVGVPVSRVCDPQPLRRARRRAGERQAEPVRSGVASAHQSERDALKTGKRTGIATVPAASICSVSRLDELPLNLTVIVLVLTAPGLAAVIAGSRPEVAIAIGVFTQLARLDAVCTNSPPAAAVTARRGTAKRMTSRSTAVSRRRSRPSHDRRGLRR